jgi:hypothetical protein
MFYYVTDLRLEKVYVNGLKSVKNKCNNWKLTSLRKTATMLDPVGDFILTEFYFIKKWVLMMLFETRLL